MGHQGGREGVVTQLIGRWKYGAYKLWLSLQRYKRENNVHPFYLLLR